MKMLGTHSPKGPYQIVVGEDEEMTRIYSDMVKLSFGGDTERAAVLQRHSDERAALMPREKVPVKLSPRNPETIPFSIHLLSFDVLESAGKGAHLWR